MLPEKWGWTMSKNRSDLRIFVDSGAPSLYNTLARADKGAGHMGSYLSDRKYDDFSWITTPDYLRYRDAYIEFIKKYIDYIDVYANLDIINNAEATWANQQYLEAAGIKPIPVWHFGCDVKWLLMYLEKGYDYIAIGGLVPNPPKILIPALDEMFSKYLTDSKGMPLVKLHGFAVTSPKLVVRYPWYSVDSTSWVKFGKYGIVCIPRIRNGVFIYEDSSWSVCVSNRSPSQKIEGKHFSTLSEAEQNFILEYIHKKGYKMGSSEFHKESEDYKLKDNERWIGKKGSDERIVETIVEQGLCNDYRLRDELNIIYYLDLQKSVPEWPWAFKHKSKTRGFDLFGRNK